MTDDTLDELDANRRRGDAMDDVEGHTEFVRACVPTAALTRTWEVIQFDIERPGCTVTLVITADALEVRLPTVDWSGGHTPVPSTRLWKRVLWKRLGDDQAALQALVDAAFEKRRREFVPCRYCKEPTPPEHRHGRVCHGCAEAHLGVVH